LRRIIVTADDFGIAREVNNAVERAHRAGVLTAASLMVGASQAADAVASARRLPSLCLGLHLALAEEGPMLPPPAFARRWRAGAAERYAPCPHGARGRRQGVDSVRRVG